MARTSNDHTAPARGGARRRRPLLLTLTAAGVTTGLLSLAGVLAVGSDQATTGVNDVHTPELEVDVDSVDLVIAPASYEMESGTFTCGADYVDDLESGVVTSNGSDLSTQYPVFENYDEGYLCLRNDSEGPIDVSASTRDVVDSELACSPGEGDGDLACAGQQGELSSHLTTYFFLATDGEEGACYGFPTAEGTIADLEDAETTIEVATLDPGEVLGLCPGVAWDRDPVSQTDEVQWRYVFHAVESDGGSEEPEEPVDCPTDDIDEPNDSMSSPTPGLVLTPGGDEYYGRICLEDPTDWWAASSSLSGATTVTVSWVSEAVDLDLFVYDHDGNVLGRSEASSGNSESVTVEASEIGYVQVSQWSGTSGVRVYGVRLSDVSPPA